MANITISYEVQLREPNWYPHMPTYLWPDLKGFIYTLLLYNPIYGKDLLMIYSSYSAVHWSPKHNTSYSQGHQLHFLTPDNIYS